VRNRKKESQAIVLSRVHNGFFNLFTVLLMNDYNILKTNYRHRHIHNFLKTIICNVKIHIFHATRLRRFHEEQ
jgi:hypothetical protein